MNRFLIAASAALLFVTAASGQSVQQSGVVTPNTVAIWGGVGIIKGGVTATDSPLTTFGVTRDASDGICVSSDRSTAAGRNQLCLQAATSGPAKISLQNYGTASPQNLQFILNGVTLTLPAGGGTFLTASGAFIAGHAACFLNTAGVIQDCGTSLAAGTQFGLPYYSTTSTLGSTGAGTNGQLLVGQTSSIPLWKTLTGDVGSISAAGALVLQSVNSIPFASTYAAHGILLGEGSSAFASSVTNNVGYCFLSQGLSADPIWAACASGSGSAGGSTTQVQFNNSTSLAGSVNFTWTNPTLTLGVAGTTTGQLGLASSTPTGTVTLQAPGVATAYNFNFPTGAGSSGQPLISGGGGSTPNTIGTLGIFGGGTNCAAASGTCLDNITGFASNGYIRRTGAGTYTQVSPIPVSDGGTNLASGTSGGILGFTAAGTLASSAALAANGFVIGGGAGATPTAIAACINGQLPVGATGAPPVCQTLSGDITTVSSAGLVTIANSAITVAKQANANAWTLAGNFTGSSAAPQYSAIGSLTQKASPVAGDYIMIQDNSAAGALKYATVSSVASAGSVSSIAGNTGAFTIAYPLGNVVNDIRYVGPTDSGQLTWTSTTALAFKPYKGDTIKINGVVMQIPSGGIAGLGAPTNVFLNGVAAQTLAINTTYYIYAFSNSGTVTADFSTTGHSASATAGNVGTEIKTGDDTRSLIGMVRTGGTVIYADDIRTASWFNRRRKSAIVVNSLVAAGNTTAMNFVTWAEEAFTIMWSGFIQNTALANPSFQNRLDTSVIGASYAATTGGANYTLPLTATRVMTSTEGNHAFDSTLSVAGSSVTGESSVEIRG